HSRAITACSRAAELAFDDSSWMRDAVCTTDSGDCRVINWLTDFTVIAPGGCGAVLAAGEPVGDEALDAARCLAVGRVGKQPRPHAAQFLQYVERRKQAGVLGEVGVGHRML